jgi:serine/threonine-protein kinase
MKSELLEENENRAMFLDEGKLAARLNHPNIVQTYEVQIGKQYFGEEYLDGQPLHRILRGARRWAIRCRSTGTFTFVRSWPLDTPELRDYDGTPRGRPP